MGKLSCLIVVALAAVGRAGEVRIDGREYTLPDGFTIERVAGPPLVDRPIVGAFDDEGRLYVADSSGSNDKVEKQLAEKPHRIVRLEDSNGDGTFERHTVFADKMMFPEGTMWYDGSLYVSTPPSIWRLTDTDGDGVADQRVEWFQGKTLTGCANDLHGPYLGPDGWIYWCKGAFAQQTYERPGQAPFVTRASHVFRCRPDGAGLEPVMTGGMDNPVDVVFTTVGERIFTTTFLQQPGGGKRDGLIHAIYGGVYGKVHDVLDGHKRTGPDVLPPLAHLGPAAPCGLARAESDALGPGFRDNLFATLFNLRKVVRVVLDPSGTTFSARVEDFLATEDHDFHPTDVHEDADGSLLVLDTGGWYKLCCPTSQLVKPDVLGAIYRVRRKDAPRILDPRGTSIGWARLNPSELTSFLDDPRPAVRERAIQALAKHGAESFPALDRARPVAARRNAVWAATRIDDPAARAFVRKALDDPDSTVRQVALHAVSLHRDREAGPRLIELLGAPAPFNQRVAAEALGRLRDPAVVPALLDAAAQPVDLLHAHALTYALIEIADPDATAAGLRRSEPSVRRAALVALDQMEGGRLEVNDVAPLLSAADPALAETAAWIVGRHPEWGESLAGALRARWSADRAGAERLLARFARATPIQALLAERLRAPAASSEDRRGALRAMARSGLNDLPRIWSVGIAEALASADAELVRQAVATARALPVAPPTTHDDDRKALANGLLAVAASEEMSAQVRLDALAAQPGGLTRVDAKLFAFLRAQLRPDQPPAARTAAAAALAQPRLEPDQLLALTDVLKSAGPLEAERLLAPFEKSSNEAVGIALVAALKQSPALAGLRVETLKPRLARFGAVVQTEAQALYSTIEAAAAGRRTRLEQLANTLDAGDVRRGQTVFNGPKAACHSCHAIGYVGGILGPDLTRIGQVRTERDLLESIIFPSASFVRSYEPVVVATRSGKVVSGLLRKDSPDEVVLATGANEEARVARDDIEETRPGTVSIMPAGLDQQLTPRELADLISFLKACK